MCEKLCDLKEAVRAFGERFDPASVSSSQAEKLYSEITVIESIIASVKAMAAARAAESGGWKAKGHRSAADALAKMGGTTVSTARATIDTGQRLSDQPETRQAALSGRLSPAQTALVAEGAAADPEAAGELIEVAGQASIAELKDHVGRVRARSEDLEARWQSIHRRRGIRRWTSTDGAWHMHAAATPEVGAQISAAITPIADRIFDNARREGKRESPEAYELDALLELCLDATTDSDEEYGPEGPPSETGLQLTTTNEGRPGNTPSLFEAPGDPTSDAPCATSDPPIRKKRGGRRRRKRRGAPVKLLVRVDLEALLRGFPIEGEVCELVGYGPVPMTIVHDLLEINDPFVGAIVTKGKELRGVAHLGRKPTAFQRSALEWLSPSCTVLGCSAQARLQTDHRIDWSETHITMLDLLDRLCVHHHRLKTDHGWALVEGKGKRAFVPPDDPRNPFRGRPRPRRKRRTEPAEPRNQVA